MLGGEIESCPREGAVSTCYYELKNVLKAEFRLPSGCLCALPEQRKCLTYTFESQEAEVKVMLI